jgi:glutaminyl-tRNA synthetase
LRYAFIIKCEEVLKDAQGNIVQLNCTYDSTTRSGSESSGTRKVKGTIHWVAAKTASTVTVRLYDRLFKSEHPEDAPPGQTFIDNMNPDSIRTIEAKVEPAVAACKAGDRVQFERNGYFCADVKDSEVGKPVFNRIVTLKDTWAKIAAKS